jgi:predicted LPLAT superfamily acyltransferase
LSASERGTVSGIRFVLWLATLFGRWPTRQLMRLLAAWYYVIDGAARRASADYLRRLHGRDPSRRAVYRHLLTFAHVTLDRLFMLRGDTHHFEFTRTGHDYVATLADERTGAIFLGAHLGSIDAMRASAEDFAIPINILGYFANAKMINAVFEGLNPDIAARVIHIEPGSVGFILEAKARLAEGELVALLGDRAGLNDSAVTVDFLGAPARFAAGPFTMAAVLKCPVYLTVALYRAPNRYDLYCEPFAERIELPREDRQAALETYARAYAERLEFWCREAPDNWFNFFDFWG